MKRAVAAGLLAGTAALLAHPRPIVEPLQLAAIVDVRDVRGSAPPVFVWDAGTTASLILRGHVTTPPAALLVFDGRAWPLLTRIVNSPQRDRTRLEIKLPATTGQGRLTLDGGKPSAVLELEVELWPAQDSLLKRLNEASPGSVKDASDAEATAIWLQAFRRALRTGDFVRAGEHAAQWERGARARGLDFSANRALLIRSFVSVSRGQIEPAVSLALVGAARSARYPVLSQRASSRNTVANALMAAGAGDAALFAAETGEAISREAGLHETEAILRSTRALILARRGRFEAALGIIRKGDEVAIADADEVEGDILLRRWESARDWESFDAAVEALEASLRRARGKGDTGRSDARAVELAWAHARRGDAVNARRHLEGLTEGAGRGGVVGLPTLARAQIALLEGQPELTIALLEPLVARPPARWDQLDFLVEVEGRELLARAHLDLGAPTAAASMLEAALLASYGGLSGTQHGGSGRRPVLARRERLRALTVQALARSGHLQRALLLDDRHRQAAVRAGPPHIAAELRPALLAAAEQLKGAPAPVHALFAELTERVPPRAPEAHQWSDPPNLGALQSVLGEGEALWVSLDSESDFFIDGEQVRYGEAPSDLMDFDHIYLVTERVEDGLARADAWAKRPGSPTLSLVPYATWLLRTPPPVGSGAVIVADPEGDLPFARDEGAALSREVGGQKWLGEGPSSADLLGAVDGVELFHFAGHAELPGDNPFDTRLRLGNDDILTVGDWWEARPQLRLAVLNGCVTGGLSAMAGELGFPHAILESGAHAVLATVRPVEDREASMFLRDFYAAGGRARPAHGWRRALQRQLERGRPGQARFLLWGRP